MRWTMEVAFCCLATFTGWKRPVMALLPMVLVFCIGFLLAKPSGWAARPKTPRAPQAVKGLRGKREQPSNMIPANWAGVESYSK